MFKNYNKEMLKQKERAIINDLQKKENIKDENVFILDNCKFKDSDDLDRFKKIVSKKAKENVTKIVSDILEFVKKTSTTSYYCLDIDGNNILFVLK